MTVALTPLEVFGIIIACITALWTGQRFWLNRILAEFREVARTVNVHATDIAVLKMENSNQRDDILTLKQQYKDIEGFLARDMGFRIREDMRKENK